MKSLLSPNNVNIIDTIYIYKTIYIYYIVIKCQIAEVLSPCPNQSIYCPDKNIIILINPIPYPSTNYSAHVIRHKYPLKYSDVVGYYI